MDDQTKQCARCFNPVRLAEAEFAEEPAPTHAAPERTITRRFHPACLELSQAAVEMGRRLGGGSAL